MISVGHRRAGLDRDGRYRHASWHAEPRFAGPGSGLGRDLFAGDVYVFGERNGTLIKAIWNDGVGLSLYAKRLDGGRFIWPQTVNCAVALAVAQVGYLPEGIDWRNPQKTWRPQAAR